MHAVDYLYCQPGLVAGATHVAVLNTLCAEPSALLIAIV